MSDTNELIQELMTKPLPSNVKEFNVQINTIITDETGNKQNVSITIEDKIKEDLIDTKKFMKSIKSKSKVLNTISQKIEASDETPKEKEDKQRNIVNKLIIKPGARKKLKEKQTDVTISAVNEVKSIKIGDEVLERRLPLEKSVDSITKSNYFMNNRERFVTFINDLFKSYRKDIIDENKESCSDRDKNEEQKLFTHQKIVRDYINLYTPYRGVLLYHGLGSGKTCSSIAIAENILKNVSIITAESMITNQKILVMTPASLQTNYVEEIKNCGNPIYKKKQFWEFINTTNSPEQIEVLSTVLTLPTAYIRENNGAWLVNVQKDSNYDKLNQEDKKSLDKQLKTMIDYKFQFINYNGLRKTKLKELSASYTKNIFDNKVVIIDEAHNFVSRIVNKVEKEGDALPYKNTNEEIALTLYEMLLSATNCKVVLLTGTPIINYPNEIGIMFNILRGYIKTWHINISPGTGLKSRLTTELLQKILNKKKHLDYISYNSNVLSITRNPFGFISSVYADKYKGVKLDTKGDVIDDNSFIADTIKTLKANDIEASKSDVRIVLTKALPDKLEGFNNKFVDSDKGDLKNIDILKRRIIGLTSYLNDKENLMPKYDVDKDFHVIHIEMSDYQFAKYQEVRNAEITKDQKKSKNKGLFKDSASSYRIFSRSYCNFVFPEDYPRPLPNEGGIEENVENIGDENDIDGISEKEKNNNPDGIVESPAAPSPAVSSYQQKIIDALDYISLNADTVLSVEALENYSPKFLHIIQNILNNENIGLHLIYSQFRTLEGIGIFSLVLKANGFIQFKIKKNSSGQYVIDVPEGLIVSQRMFAMYTGKESAEEKELIRNIYNGEWDALPLSLSSQLKKSYKNNQKGEIIKIMMITASGAEGISLKNTRFVHIMEPYWHPVRTEQVIGRARRICSHEGLEDNLQNVKVMLYLMKFSQSQILAASNQLKRYDVSKFDRENRNPMSTDENLYELSRRKQSIHKQLLKCIKETAIDCAIQYKSESGENLECYSFSGESDPNVYSYKPKLSEEEVDRKIQKANLKEVIFKAKRYTADGKDYAMKMNDDGKPSGLLYDMDMYQQAKNNPNIKLFPIGKVTKKDGKTFIDFN